MPINEKDLDDIDDEQLEPEVTMELGFPTVIVVDNIPVVPVEKYDKLLSVVNKIYQSLGNVKQLYMPQDENKTTKGFAFVEFATPEEAENAVAKTNGYKLDKSHVFRVSMYDDFEKYMKVPDVYAVPETKPYEARPHLGAWLLSERTSDQYVIRHGDWTEVLWNEIKPGEEPPVDISRQNWTDTYVQWSPKGSYLLTVHSKGVAVWGGPKWDKLNRFPHSGVKLVHFSPSEKYLVTASPQYAENDNPKDPQCIIVWDIRSGKKLRGFPGGSPDLPLQWPVFKWSHDDKYLARLGDGAISVYEAPSMDMLDKKSIKVEGVKDFAWSPSDHIISYFVPENQNKPATVVLMDIPSRRERRTKNLFNVTDCKLYWHPSGDYLACKVDRQKKKQTWTNFELFRMREKDIPTDLLEIKTTIHQFAWEPQGTRFAVIHGEPPRPDVSFYDMSGQQVKLLKTLEKRSANHLFWSPVGGNIVLAGLHNLNGALEFFNVDNLETLGNEEHFMCTAVDWDPTGRFVTTVVSFWRHQLENGYNIYNFQGKLLKHALKDKFYQLLWRPRPPTLLSKEQIADIKKNLHKRAKEFKEREQEQKKAERAERQRKRDQLRNDFQKFLDEKRAEHDEQKEARRMLRGEDSEDERDFDYIEEWVQEVEEVQEVVLED